MPAIDTQLVTRELPRLVTRELPQLISREVAQMSVIMKREVDHRAVETTLVDDKRDSNTRHTTQRPFEKRKRLQRIYDDPQRPGEAHGILSTSKTKCYTWATSKRMHHTIRPESPL
ncbi:hypothetical protein M426DRAFT_27194 [Hypoxylon sp. CI-4A]|nr:hypothetical protein M426DRAFT_27194 [Hypoxylon sp. CI-4A]